jgi:hypothetical protein
MLPVNKNIKSGSISGFAILFVFLCICLSPAQAQSVDKNIRDAKSTVANAVKSDPKKLPDSLAWKKGGSVSLNFSQISFSDSWSGGGENQIALNSTLNLFANYRKNKLIWENNVFFAYGTLKKENMKKATKNDDQINIGSRMGYQMAKNWYYSAAFLGKSQFAPGYKYSSTDTTRVSDFLAPAYLYLSLGLDYKPSSSFSMLVSPVMGKATLVRSDDQNVMRSAGLSDDIINKGKHSRYEFGGGVVFSLNGNFFEKRVTYTTQLELFSNYLNNPQNIDVNWDFQFRMALTKYIAASVRLNMIYDDDQKIITKEKQPDNSQKDVSHGAKLQVKQFFEIGLFYAF